MKIDFPSLHVTDTILLSEIITRGDELFELGTG